jgi:hypothetical protein
MIAFSPDSKSLLQWKGGDRLRIWDARGKDLLPHTGHEQPIRSLRLTPDGRDVISMDTGENVRFWDAQTTQATFPRALVGVPEEKEATLTQSAVSSDGRLQALVSRCERVDRVEIRDIDQKRQILELILPEANIRALAFSPDGHSLAVAGEPWGVGLWELTTGQLRRTFRGHVGPVNAVLFSADGRRLFTGGEDWTILVWDVLPAVDSEPARLLDLWNELACEEAARAFRAMSRLVQMPRQTLALVRNQSEAGRSSEPAERLIARLSSDCFENRQQAAESLLRLGPLARQEIRVALQAGPPLDLERQLRQLLDDIQANRCSANELRQLRVVELLERLGDVEAEQSLRSLAERAGPARIREAARAALRRLNH